MIPEPLISIITASYNSVNTIGESIDSVQSQHYKNIEHIVIDGGSADGTKELLLNRSFKEWEKTERNILHSNTDFRGNPVLLQKFISEADKGIYDALNKGINAASGDLFGLLHSDDLFSDESILAKITAAFTKYEADIVYGDLVYFSDSGRIIRYWKSGEFNRNKLKYGWMPPHPTLFIKKKIFEELGAYNINFRIAADYDFILRLFSNPNYKIIYIPEILVKMRSGGKSNKNLKNILQKSREDYKVLVKNNFEHPILTLICKNFRKTGQFFANMKA